MPISRKPGELKEDFIARCIPIEIGNGYSPDQASAICYTYWEEKQLKAVKNIRRKMRKEQTENFEKTRVYVDSSNVDRLMYDDVKEQLVIQFQDGSFYTYFNITQARFDDIVDGNATCVSDDSQIPQRWWIGKNPSVGAAVHKFLVNAGIKYERGGSFR
jgi:hypothetical protein